MTFNGSAGSADVATWKPAWKDFGGTWKPIWKDNGSGVMVPMWHDFDEECACCGTIGGTCEECLASANGIGLSISNSPNGTLADCPCPDDDEYFSFDGGYALTEPIGTGYKLTVGTVGDYGDPGILIANTAWFFCSRLETYIYQFNGSAACSEGHVSIGGSYFMQSFSGGTLIGSGFGGALDSGSGSIDTSSNCGATTSQMVDWDLACNVAHITGTLTCVFQLI